VPQESQSNRNPWYLQKVHLSANPNLELQPEIVAVLSKLPQLHTLGLHKTSDASIEAGYSAESLETMQLIRTALPQVELV